MTTVDAFLDRFDRAWLERDWEALSDCFLEQVVMVLPGFARKVLGREAMLQSYREFMGRAEIEAFETKERSIDIFGDMAVTAVKWRMKWTSEGKSYDEEGRELLVLVKREGAWKAAWRTMV